MMHYELKTLHASAVEVEGTPPRRTSLLELLHPNGISKRSLVIGSNAPALLLPAPRVAAGEYADLVILAPSVTECHTPGWLETAAQSLARKLERDGVAYVLAQPR